ncbi:MULTISPECIES: hypothetical protein [Actinoalloteichus]|nr:MULTISPECIES: hypothetical protein [Actinoalloteichus]
MSITVRHAPAEAGELITCSRRRPAPTPHAARPARWYRVRQATTARQGVGEPAPSIPEWLSLERRPRREPSSVPADQD